MLAAAAAAVSFTAQYRLVFAARGIAVAAALEAALPDAAALVFACLGVALALHGRHAVRARLLNAASAGTSVFMNVIAAAPGWRDVAVWVMPPAAYALASDTLIGVVRTRAATAGRDLAAGLLSPPQRVSAVPHQGGSAPRTGTKTARFLALVAERHGPLAAIPVPAVSRISASIAPQVGLNAGAARAALRRAVLAAQDGGIR